MNARVFKNFRRVIFRPSYNLMRNVFKTPVFKLENQIIACLISDWVKHWIEVKMQIKMSNFTIFFVYIWSNLKKKLSAAKCIPVCLSVCLELNFRILSPVVHYFQSWIEICSYRMTEKCSFINWSKMSLKSNILTLKCPRRVYESLNFF